MVHVSNQNGMILITKEELESLMKREYDRGVQDATESRSPIRARAHTKFTDSGADLDFRAAVVESENG